MKWHACKTFLNSCKKLKSTHKTIVDISIWDIWKLTQKFISEICVMTLTSHACTKIDWLFTGRRNSKKLNRYRNCPYCKQVMVSLDFFAHTVCQQKNFLFTLFLCSDDFLLLTHNRYVAGVLKIHCICKNVLVHEKKIAHFFGAKKEFWVREMESEV